ncbi:hypothetical protein [Longimicrobium sp.]|uniref:hypothetical protein n=1 Tax=Longimicrobium sp. TaxID=2029185 RepID=UPI002ED84ABC
MKALAMKVVYDISSLGLGHADRVHRTGIFRVVERLAQELLAMDECEVTFSAAMGAGAPGSTGRRSSF